MYQQRKNIKKDLIKITELEGINIYNMNYITEKFLEDARKAQKLLIKLDNRESDWINEYNKFVKECSIRHEFLKKYDNTLIQKKSNPLPFYYQ